MNFSSRLEKFQYSLRVSKAILLVSLMSGVAVAQKPKTVKPPLPVAYIGNKLVYTPDSLGNRIPDFSYCGYKASATSIPFVAVKVVVPIVVGDATQKIQAAINQVAQLPLDANGFRGAVLLQKGIYQVWGQLKIESSGIIIRGAGAGDNGTKIMGAGTDRQTLIRIAGKNDRKDAPEIKITNAYVPVNAVDCDVEDASSLKVGASVIIRRPATANWIADLGTEHFGGGITALGWKPGKQDLYFDRTITAIENNHIKFDVPITTALDQKYGGGFINTYEWKSRINNVGIENIALSSSYDKSNSKDEAHRWMAITIESTEDAWVRQINFSHFAGSAVSVLETAKRVTIEDCISTAPISEIGGQRRYTFFTTGQQTLFQRCYAEEGYHDFATGFCAPGPNAFVQCSSMQPYHFSGGIDSWSSGILFDVVYVDGQALRFGNRGQDAQGAGWTAANSMFWNCSASRIDCYKPPTAQNYSFGSWAEFSGDGYWTASNDAMNPRSFYYTQLKERVQKNVDAQAQILPVASEASSSPSVEVAAQLTRESVLPKMQMNQWIAEAAIRNPIPISYDLGLIKAVAQDIKPSDAKTNIAAPLNISNGILVRGNVLLFGNRQGVPWWNGGVKGKDAQKASLALTRFVPGREGHGLTDNIEEVATAMKQRNIIGIEQHYGLWYDRRRDDHERIRRMDGDVWPPFYELPFARSGKEIAWDGLSKYDLTKYNTWYWNRLKQFADVADKKGLLLVHQNYFQHNIIEAGAHYADFPWRSANNINNAGFPEPPPYAGDKRIFLAEQFYDISNPTRKEIHKKYIRQCLNNFKDNNGVIQLIGEEFTGPQHFVSFWLEVIKEWEQETGKKQLIGLSCTKDVQDAILQNEKLAAIVDIIDIRYWHYQADSSVYAPMGGQNLAPRQHARLLKPRKTSFNQVYRAVKEYRLKFPNKAVVYSSDSYDQFGWAVLLAGGSLPVLPASTNPAMLEAATKMHVVNGIDGILTDSKSIIGYNIQAKTLESILNANQNYKVDIVDLNSGITSSQSLLNLDAISSLQVTGKIIWIRP